MSKKKILIIGAGFGGLASAALLAKDGYQVTVIEKNEQAGGRAGLLKAKGFQFDMGPSWYMMPDVFERYFKIFGKSSKDFYHLKPLTPQYRVFFENQEYIDISGNISKDKALFEKLEPGFSQNFDRYLQESKEKYEIAMNAVLYKNMDTIFDLISPEMAKAGPKMGIFQPMHSYVKKFFKHPRIQKILEYNLVFLGCSPQNAPSLFSLITHVDWNLGVWYPKEGMYAIVEALVKLGKQYGVTYIYNAPVEQIIVKNKKVSGVQTLKKFYPADAVISNADYAFTEDILSDQSLRSYAKKWWQKKTLAPSAFLLYLGIKGKIPKLQHHTLYFGDDWDEHFKSVFTSKKWPKNPSVYINVTSRSDKKVAPPGHENLMVLVPVAPGLSETEESKKTYAKFIISFIEKKLQISLEKNIVYQKIFSVSDFSSRYNSYQGNALGGLAHTFFQSSIWRPNNTSKKIPNLFFAGANTVPGIGIPPAIISSHLVRERISKYFSNT